VTLLRELIDVQHRSVRAVNLDEDLGDPEVLRGYAPGAHVIDALRRIAIALQDEPRTRAWSITGPYGSGKSSFAHLLCSLLGPKSEPTHRVAAKLLRTADPQLADTVTRERRRLGVAERGLIPAVVTADREPIADALVRALSRGAELYWSGPGRKPDLLHRLRNAAIDGHSDPDFLLSVFDGLIATAPVLVVVDELGKNLEYAADRAGSDLYLLQQLAERVSSRASFSGGVLTLAHLAFEDYLVGAGDARRREWRKIHGRFEDIPFVANTAHAIGLLAEALHFTGPAPRRKAAAAACEAAEAGVRTAAGQIALPGELADSQGATYPLHPTVALALPALAAHLGQHDRSLVAFLTSDAPHALPSFLLREEISSKAVPFVRLADLYDYFFADGAATVLTGPEGERAREIKGRIDEAQALDEFELRVLKTLGILNLLRGVDRLVASARLVEEATVGPDGGAKKRRGVRAVLDRLTERSLLTYREFSGEYRVWEGSDFDTRGQIAAARERLTSGDAPDEQVLRIVAEAHPLRPAVARRHSQRHHILRYFECRYARKAPTKEIEVESMDADGLVVYVLADGPAPKSVPAKTADGRPLVLVWSPHGGDVREVALDFAAARVVLAEAPELERDAVARREMRHRVAALQAALANRADEAFSPARRGVWWFASAKRRKAGGSAEFSRLLSDLCEKRYPRTPIVRNEMVNRRELTSQGAKARRVVLERMFTHEQESKLGIEGYGPERAMYEAVLHHTGLHAERGEHWAFGPPPRDGDLADVWEHLMGLLDSATEMPLGVDELYRKLLGPPFGMKVGVVPLLLSAALQCRADDVFLYQDGSFQPVVDAAHIERLLKTPERFSLKRASLVGVRASVFAKLRETLASDTRVRTDRRLRNETTLGVVRPLIAFASALPEYTRRAKTPSETAQRVCTALLNAREPDELLFAVLPEACDLPPFSSDANEHDEKAAAEYVERLRSALAELGSEYARLLEKIGDLLHAGFGNAGPRRALREDVRSRSRRLLQQVIEPKMRSFLATAADEQLDDDDWLEALAMTLASKPPSSWTDHDVAIFEALAAERAQWFRRLELLYHEMHGTKGAGFDARRVTLTAPDGTETAELVRVDQATCELVDDVLDQALGELKRRVGAQAPQALLGVLTTRLLSSDEATREDVSDERRRVREA
jgi:hypothetical protein